VVLLVVSTALALLSLTIPALAFALAAMILPMAVLNYRWPQATLLNLVAVIGPVWLAGGLAAEGHQAAAERQLAFAGVVSALALFLGLCGWVGGRIRRGTAVEPPPGFEVKSLPLP
jgi:hypothetical protein